MELTNEFRVAASPATTWAVLTDLERIAPCLPGAQLLEVEGELYRGAVKVKVGPVVAQYKGTATFLSLDEATHTAVLKADGRETRGQGNASATVTLTLVPDGDGTKATVLTDLKITGKVAQFGRGVIADVSSNLIGKFVESLETTVLSDAGPDSAAPVEGATAGETGPAAAAPATTEPADAAPAAEPLAPAAWHRAAVRDTSASRAWAGSGGGGRGGRAGSRGGRGRARGLDAGCAAGAQDRRARGRARRPARRRRRAGAQAARAGRGGAGGRHRAARHPAALSLPDR
jgi:carbon monoxide dehydrogenase subunit G